MPPRLPRTISRAAARASLVALALAASPPATQAETPAEASCWNSAAYGVLDHPAFPRGIALAWQGVVDEGFDRSAVTLALPGGAATEALRRFGARLTIGGPLQQVNPSNLARAERLTNHVTTEFRVALDRDPAAPGPLRYALAFTADNLATTYGLDRYGVTLMAERAGRVRATANAGLRRQERYHVPFRDQEVVLGAGASTRLAAWRGPVRALDVELQAGVLVRNLHRPDVWRGGVRLDAPVGERLHVTAAFRGSDLPEMRGVERTAFVIGAAADLGPRGR